MIYLCYMIDEGRLNTILRSDAIGCGLCSQWQKEWSADWNKDKLIRRFFKGIDFFLDTRFVSNEEIKKLFDREYLRGKGILVDDTHSLLNPKNAILLGASTARIRMNAYNTGTLYVTDTSKVSITARNSSFIMVHALGAPRIDVTQEDKAQVVIIKHSHDCVVASHGDVKIKEEYNYLK